MTCQDYPPSEGPKEFSELLQEVITVLFYSLSMITHGREEKGRMKMIHAHPTSLSFLEKRMLTFLTERRLK